MEVNVEFAGRDGGGKERFNVVMRARGKRKTKSSGGEWADQQWLAEPDLRLFLTDCRLTQLEIDVAVVVAKLSGAMMASAL